MDSGMDIDEMYEGDEENYLNMMINEIDATEKGDYLEMFLDEIYEREEENYMELLESEENEIEKDNYLRLMEGEGTNVEEDEYLQLLENNRIETEEDNYLLERNIVLRNYQLKLLEQAKRQNSIIYLPTGAGKTLIAIHALCSRTVEINRPFSEGGKRAFFLTPTKVLVHQLARVLSTHTKFKVMGVTGDLNVDSWSGGNWKSLFEKVHVFVMTAEILKVILQLNFISPSRISFLVLDECHHAVYDHPYKLVLQAVNGGSGEAPLILGLTSVLFNNTPKASQVEQIVKDLEMLMNGKVVTENQLQEVLSFSTNPTDKLIIYENKSTALGEDIMTMYEKLIQVLDSLYIMPVNSEEIPMGGIDYKSHNRAKRLKNAIVVSQYIFRSLGFFGGSVCVLFYIIVFEKLRLLSMNPVEIQALVYARTELIKLRLFFQRCMGEEETVQSIVGFSSDKVQKLIRCLKEVHEARKGKHMGIIVFVKQRAMAVVLAFVLKRLSAVGSEYSFLKPEFIVGTSAFYNDSLLLSPKNDEIVEKFAARSLNVLVATNVLEEGVDLTTCNAVICFEFPMGYPSYFQSRGRARDKDGVYMMFAEQAEAESKSRSLDFFRNIERKVMQTLCQRREPEECSEDSEEALEKLSLPGKAGPILVDGITAIKAVQRYVSKLPQDKYTFLSPASWYTVSGGLKKAFVRLPMNCPLREVVEGEEKHSRRLAKRSAFLLTVKRLFEMGELNEELTPRSRELTAEECGYLFPHYRKEKVDKGLPQPGTSKRRQKYKMKFAECLSGCMPRPGTKAYLHVITFTVAFEKPPLERKVIIYETLKLPSTFALLSAKKLHKIVQFPIFMDMGKIQCSLLVNHDELVLTNPELAAIKECHFALFKKVARISKCSQVFDNRNKEHSFFVVPVEKNEENRFVLNWDLIRSDYCKSSTSALMRYNPSSRRVERSQTQPLSEQTAETNALLPVDAINGRVLWAVDQADGLDRPKFMMTESDYRYFVIFPNYRNQDFPQRYIVNKFCQDMSPLSPFPKPHFNDYIAYYKHTYGADITNVHQPLLRVSPIFNCLNFNKPRMRMLERKQMKHYEEHLVPELCDVIPFDRRFYLKALLLPTVLNRICHVYCVEEFRRRLVGEMGAGARELPEGAEWTGLEQRMDSEAEEGEASGAATELALPLSKLMEHSQKSQKVLDSERHLYEVGLCDLEFSVRILKSSVESGEEQELKENEHLIKLFALRNANVPRLKTLTTVNNSLGPDLGYLVQAFTSKSANDSINYERLEILGDSLLKFAASLFLFRNFPANEGVLTTLKGKIVGNRNLLYCALAKNLPDFINVTDFAPLSDWNPPLISIPENLLDHIVREDLDPAVIYRFDIPLEEQFSGVLSDKTLQKNEEILRGYTKSYDLATNSLLPYKVISDKTVSDCSEALIGVYLLNSGISGALDFLVWLQVLPSLTGTYAELIDKPYCPPPVPADQVLLFLQEIFYSDLEDTLNYHFNNKALLLEAITHPSYSKNRLTDCYQRLEFLGDAVLDFLITSYIYEHCGNLTPGQVTDIRSSLVSNITFACLTVRYELHKYLLSFSSSLITTINKFVAFQAERDHVVDENVMILPEDEYFLGETVQVPKALGDIFEALAGAIYLDSGNSLETVWRVYYVMMKRELDEFTKTVPKTPVRLLCEICCDKPYFESKVLSNGTVMVSCVVYYDNEEIKAYGFGVNKKDAKKSACKMALNKILSLKK